MRHFLIFLPCYTQIFSIAIHADNMRKMVGKRFQRSAPAAAQIQQRVARWAAGNTLQGFCKLGRGFKGISPVRANGVPNILSVVFQSKAIPCVSPIPVLRFVGHDVLAIVALFTLFQAASSCQTTKAA